MKNIFLLMGLFTSWLGFGQKSESSILKIKHTSDFDFSVDGTSSAWASTEWTKVPHRAGAKNYETRIKLLYSDTGIYGLFIVRMKSAPGAALVQGNALSLPYPNETFDITYCHFLLLWVRDP